MEQATRYAELVSAITQIPAEELTPAAARKKPQPQTVALISLIPSTPPPGRHQYRDLIGQALGSKLADRTLREAAWPALQHALHHAEDNGHDLTDLLRIHTNRRDLNRAFSVSEALAWRIHRHLIVRPTPPESDGNLGIAPSRQTNEPTGPTADQSSDPAQRSETWRAIAWSLAGHERHGGTVEDVLPPTPSPAHDSGIPNRAPTLADLKQRMHDQLRDRSDKPPTAEQQLPWLISPQPDGETYLRSAALAIDARIQHLVEMVEADPPRWADGIGERPNDPALLTQWRGHVGVVATYRELHDITHDDPAYPLGPYIEPNQPGHHEFWHAAAAVLATHNLTEEDSTPAQATPTGEAHGLSSVSGPPLDSDRFDEVALRAAVAHRIAADTYRALPDSERTAVTAGLITRLGNLRFDNDPATTVTQALYARQLQAALAERGHLSPNTGNLPAQTLSGNTFLRRQHISRAKRDTKSASPQPEDRRAPSAPPAEHPPRRPALLQPPSHERQDGPRPRR